MRKISSSESPFSTPSTVPFFTVCCSSAVFSASFFSWDILEVSSTRVCPLALEEAWEEALEDSAELLFSGTPVHAVMSRRSEIEAVIVIRESETHIVTPAGSILAGVVVFIYYFF